MEFFNMIKRVFRRLLFWKKRKRPTGVLTEDFKKFYDVELLRNARVVSGLFGDSHLNQPHGGVEVKFIRHTDFAVEPSSSTSCATVDTEERRSGKTVEMIRRATENNGAIFVKSKERADDITAMAIRLGSKPPRVVVYARGQVRGISVIEQIMKLRDDPCIKAVRCELGVERDPVYEALKEAVTSMRKQQYPARLHYFTSAISDKAFDEYCKKYFNGSGVIVVDRNGQGWLNGEPCEREV